MKLEGKILRAEAGKVLHCVFNGLDYGTEVSLGYVWYDKEGALLAEPRMLTAADFAEADDPELGALAEEVRRRIAAAHEEKAASDGEVEDGAEEASTDGYKPSYAEAKREAVKLRYSNDDQIALMLNYAEQPALYAADYEAMQRWRETAAVVAKMITGGEA